MKNLFSLSLIGILAAALTLSACSSGVVIPINKAAQLNSTVYEAPVEINGVTVMAAITDKLQQYPGLYSHGADKVSKTFLVYDKGLNFHIIDDYSLLSSQEVIKATSLGPEQLKAAEKGKKVVIEYDLYFQDGEKKIKTKQVSISN